MNRQVNNCVFNHKKKLAIRKEIVDGMGPSEKILDLYGGGGMHRYCKERNVNVFSIDNGGSFKNAENLRRELGTTLEINSNGRLIGGDTCFISLLKLCELVNDEFSQIWLDYCGPMCKAKENDFKAIPNIMKDEGILYITLLQGHETFLSKGVPRNILNHSSLMWIKQILRKSGVKLVKCVMKREYISRPEYDGRKGNGGSRMMVVGYKWIKTKRCLKQTHN